MQMHEQGAYKSSLTNFQEISRTHLTVAAGYFTLTEPLKYSDIRYKHISVMYNIMNKTEEKRSNDKFLWFKDVTRFGSVIGMLSYLG